MLAMGLDVLVLRDRGNICYLTGFENCYMTAYHAAIAPASGEPVLVASNFEMLNALAGSWCRDQVTFAVMDNPITATCRTLEERGFAKSRIGVEMRVLSAAALGEMSEQLPNAKFVDLADAVTAARLIKSPREIEYLRQAGRLSTRGMEAALAEVAAGKTDNQVAAAAAETMIRGGSEFPCIDPIVTVGERSGLPHSTFRRTTIGPGDAVLIEIAGCMCRYSAPLMRTAAVEPVSDAIRDAANACRDSLTVLIEQMRPGALASDAARRAKAAWTPICEQLIWHGIYAYSVGLGFPPDWNDAPVCVLVDSDFTLQPGMCFHATTSLRQGGRFGTAMSETVLITEHGNELLTGTPRELLVV